MSFYVVPSMSFQTQQKLKKEKEHKEKEKRRKKKRSSNSVTHDEANSGNSSSSATSTNSGHRQSMSSSSSGNRKSNASGEGSVHRPSQSDSVASKGSAVNAEELKRSLSSLKHTEENSSVSSPTGSSTPPVNESSPIIQSRQGSIVSSLSSNSSKINPNSNSLQQGSSQRQHGGGSLSSMHSKISNMRQHSVSEMSTLSGTRFSRKMSSSFLGPQQEPGNQSLHSTRSSVTSTASPPVVESPKSAQQSIFKSSFTEPTPSNTVIPDQHASSGSKIVLETKLRPFIPIIDLEVVNTPKSLLSKMSNPYFQAVRYREFLSTFRGTHVTDPNIFSNVRYNSVVRFIKRIHPIDSAAEPGSQAALQDNISRNESLLSNEAFQLRIYLRKMIRKYSATVPPHNIIISHEELVQVNFTNFLRYVLALPDISAVPSDQLTEEIRGHYYFKERFSKIQEDLYRLKKEELGEEGSSLMINSTENFLQFIRRLSFEYFHLEKYFIQILCQIDGNHIIEPRTLEKLFNKHCKALRSTKIRLEDPILTPERKFSSVKVLHYNTYYSSILSWHMAVSTPFANVYEMNCYSEDPTLICDIDKYYGHHEKFHKHYHSSFHDSEEKPYEQYFKKIDFQNDFSKFRSFTPEKLVALQEKVVGQVRVDGLEIDDNFNHKPKNFQFYSKSLSTIPDETFDLIQCRDTLLQFTEKNYKVILREFFRILVKGGRLEFPLVQLGADTLDRFINTDGNRNLKNVHLQPLENETLFDVMPNLTAETLRELNNIFGEGNVRYGFMLLNTGSDVIMYMLRFTQLKLFEMHGRLDEFKVETQADGSEREDGGLHYYLLLVAEKK
ncbi:hypothetical protein CLIB1423_01S01948 [[Candida] railenensis]|uniref:Uncharacterized protein n=1 Tax=[Candida] railenensis TaxID=45579 RepID=A0A9P0QJ48_9ASCO|nr:hypothetical protein CLIB1423_01S01948 [[Candida] railenensis]